jgi:cyclopropane fatty-acyl-phospholipid synthase-like methyltransferase
VTESGDPRKAIVAGGYDAIADAYAAWAARITDDPRDRMIEALGHRVPAGARLLDLGCGSGLPTTKVLAQRYAVVGVELSSVQIERARGNVPDARFIAADLVSIDFPPGSFDAVTAFYSLNHVPREEHGALFERVARWLAEDGRFLATFGLANEADWTGEWLGVPMFFSSNDRDTTRRLLREAGFELELDEVVEIYEPEGPVSFLWILARSRHQEASRRADKANALERA